jgi:hypothetical protein
MKEVACTVCGEVGRPERPSVAQVFLFGLLCAAGLLPGLVYLVILSGRYPRCWGCGSKSIVPTDTPVGKRLLEASGSSLAPTEVPANPVLNGAVVLFILLFLIGAAYFLSDALIW